jgi:hypothetical protein
VRNVANDVLVVVEYRQRSDSLTVHKKQRFFERMVAIDRDDLVTSQIKLFQRTIVQLLDRLEASSVLPQESHKSQLTQNSHDIFRARRAYDDAMATTTKDLDSAG